MSDDKTNWDNEPSVWRLIGRSTGAIITFGTVYAVISQLVSGLPAPLVGIAIGILLSGILLRNKFLTVNYVIGSWVIVVVFILGVVIWISTQSSSIKGVLVDSSGIPYDRVSLILRESNGINRNLTTDQEGRFQAKSIEQGEYTLYLLLGNNTEQRILVGEIPSGWRGWFMRVDFGIMYIPVESSAPTSITPIPPTIVSPTSTIDVSATNSNTPIESLVGQLLFTRYRDLFILDLASGDEVRLTDDYDFRNGDSRWSPDGNYIAYESQRDGDYDLYIINPEDKTIYRMTHNNFGDFDPSISPDGSTIVYVAYSQNSSDNANVYLFDIATNMIQQLTNNNSANDWSPIWSPDGTKIAFVSDADGDADIYVMNADGSDLRRITDRSEGDYSPSWTPDGTSIVFAGEDSSGDTEIFLMSSDGTSLVALTDNTSDDYGPSVSADGEYITFYSLRTGRYELYIMDIDGQNQIRVTDTEAEEFDPSLRPINVADIDLPLFEPPNLEGRIVFPRDVDGLKQLFILDLSTLQETKLTDDGNNYYSPSWSPDGSKVVTHSLRDGDYELFTIDSDGTNLTRLTNNDFRDIDPEWSPDGTKIAFASDRDGELDIFILDLEDLTTSSLTKNPNSDDWYPSWSPDGSQIAFNSSRDGNVEIYVMDADGTNLLRLTNDTATDWFPDWSPDGRQIVFRSKRDDKDDIYRINADGSNLRQVTNGNMTHLFPIWASLESNFIIFLTDIDGNKEIYFTDRTGSFQSAITINMFDEDIVDWISVDP